LPPQLAPLLQLLPPPRVTNLTEVWITQTAAIGNEWPHVTIWGLGSGGNALDDGPWNNSQRGHQFLIDASGINYGNLTASIDYDVENFQIPGSAGGKAYNWATSAVNMSGLGTQVWGTQAYGMNNALWNSASAFTSFITMGQVGEIAGTWTQITTSPCSESTPCIHGFINNNGTGTSVTDPSSPNGTSVYGINDKSDIVGVYCPNFVGETCGSQEAGFLGTSPLGASSYTSIVWNNAQNNEALGINDDEEVIGEYNADSANPTYILDQNGSLSALSLPTCPAQASGTSNLTVVAFDGFGEIGGYYSGTDGYDHGFIINLYPPGSQTCTEIDLVGGASNYVLGINNQGEILTESYSNGTACYWFLDTMSGLSYGLDGFYPMTINDAAQMVGYPASGGGNCPSSATGGLSVTSPI
jgi:hypothetical protein